MFQTYMFVSIIIASSGEQLIYLLIDSPSSPIKSDAELLLIN